MTRHRWTAAEDAVLRALYAETKSDEIAKHMGRATFSVYNRAHRLGLRKSDTFLAHQNHQAGMALVVSGAGHRFKKGQEPPNKGKACPPGVGGNHPNAKGTQFQKGVRQGVATKLYKPIGSERVSKDGYLERKIHDGLPLQSRWRAVHRIRWEEIHGPQPKGFALKCLDGNKRNTDPSNWELIPRALLPRLNGIYGRDYDHAPTELKPTILAVAKLEHAALQRDRRDGEPLWKTQRRRAKRQQERARA